MTSTLRMRTAISRNSCHCPNDMALRIGKILATPRSHVCFSAEIELDHFPFTVNLTCGSVHLFRGPNELACVNPLSVFPYLLLFVLTIPQPPAPTTRKWKNESVLLPTSRDLFNGHFVEMERRGTSAVDAPCETVSGLLLYFLSFGPRRHRNMLKSICRFMDISHCHHLYFLVLSNLYWSVVGHTHPQRLPVNKVWLCVFFLLLLFSFENNKNSACLDVVALRWIPAGFEARGRRPRANHPRSRSREDRLSRVSIAFRARALQKRGYKALCWSGY